jgi:hypothetical protein
MTMLDVRDVAEALHREAHADPEPLRLGACPFHDTDMITWRAKWLLPWYAEDSLNGSTDSGGEIVDR